MSATDNVEQIGVGTMKEYFKVFYSIILVSMLFSCYRVVVVDDHGQRGKKHGHHKKSDCNCHGLKGTLRAACNQKCKLGD